MSRQLRSQQDSERSGYCPACKLEFRWLGLPLQQDAACSKCSGALARKPKRIVGKWSTTEAPPRLKAGPKLVVTEIDESTIPY